MAYTGREIFERSMAVMDEISETGTLNPDDGRIRSQSTITA